MADWFAPSASSGSTGGSWFGGANDPVERELRERERIAALEAEIRAKGGGSFLESGKGLAARVIDLLSRTGYALAGGIEEAIREPTPEERAVAAKSSPLGTIATGAFGSDVFGRISDRMIRELASGIPLPTGQIKGEKRNLREVAERAGMPAFGSLSDLPIARALFSDTGEGWRLQRHGPLDPTGRGTILLPAEIMFDPITYVKLAKPLTLLGRGMKPAGVTRGAVELMTEEMGKLAPKAAGEALAVSRATAAGKQLAVEEARKLARTVATDDAADQMAQIVASATVKPGSKLYSAIRDSARREAEQRVLAAAEFMPKQLLDRPHFEWFGFRVPGTGATLAAASGLSREMTQILSRTSEGVFGIAAAASARKFINDVGRIASRDWLIQHLPGAKAAKTAYLDGIALKASELAEKLKKTGFLDLDAGQRAMMRKIREHPALAAQHPTLAPVIEKLGGWLDEIGAQRTIYLGKEGGIENYWPHIWDNTPEELVAIFRNVPGFRPSRVNITSSGRFDEWRVFPTVEDALEWNRKARKADPTIPLLRTVDEAEALGARASAHAQAWSGMKYAEDIAEKFARPADQGVLDSFVLDGHSYGPKMTAAQVAELHTIQAAVRKGGTDPAFVSALSDPGKREFLRQQLARAGSDREAINVLNKYSAFADHLPKQRPVAGSLAPDGTPYVTFDAIPRLKGLEIPASLAMDLQGADARIFSSPALNAILRRLDAVNNFMRTAVYSVFPSSQVRNKYTNIVTGATAVGISYLDPRLWKQSMMALHPSLRALGPKTTGITTHLGEFYPWSEVDDILRQRGVIASGRQIIEQTGLKQTITKGPRWSHRLMGESENEDRIALFLHYLRSGKRPDEAAALMKQWMVDYQDISAFDREILRRVVLFPTWAKKTVVNQVRATLETPGRQATLGKLFKGRASENQEMTTFESEGFKLRLNRDGRTISVLSGIDLPVKQLDLIWRGSAARTGLGFLGMVAPPFKAPLEAATNTSFFTGRPMGRTRSDMMGRILEEASPEWFRDYLGYDKRPDAAGRPHYTFDEARFYVLFRSYAVSRFVSTSDRAFREYLDDKNWTGLFLDLTTGLRLKDINLDEEQRKLWLERRRLVDQAAERFGLQKRMDLYYKAGQVLR